MTDQKRDSHPKLPARMLRPDGSVDTGRLKAEASIAAVALHGTKLKRVGDEMQGLCPFHDERTPSFYVNEAKGTFYCHGCAVGGDVLDLYARLHDTDFLESCIALAGSDLDHHRRDPDPERDAVRRVLASRRATDEWRGAVSIEGTPAARYLSGRGVGEGVPGTIRFSRIPRFWQNDGSEGPRHPAMIAAAQDADGRVRGIQRTYVDEDGVRIGWAEPRLALGRMRGCALRLGPVSPRIMLAAATEDALSLRLMFPGATVWSAFGDANLAKVEFPSVVTEVVLCGDADGSGRAAVLAAHEAYRAKGIRTDELFPRAGKDFNEEWMALHA